MNCTFTDLNGHKDHHLILMSTARLRENSIVHQHHQHSTSAEIVQRTTRTSTSPIPMSLQDIARRPTEALQSKTQSFNSSRVSQHRSQSRGTLGYKRSTLFIQTEPIQTPRLPSQCNEYSEITFNFQAKKDDTHREQVHRTSLMGPPVHNRSSSTQLIDESSLSYNLNKTSLPNIDLDEKQSKTVMRELQTRDSKIAKLKIENEKLTNELHKLKKAEAGMVFGGNNKLTAKNIELKSVLDSMKNEIQRLRQTSYDTEAMQESSRELNLEVNRLKKLISQYENEHQKLIVDLGQAKKSQDEKEAKLNSALKEISVLKNQFVAEQSKTEKLTAQNIDVKAKCTTLFNQLSALKSNETKNSSDEKSFSKLHVIITSLEKENKRLTDQVKDLRFQVDKDCHMKEQSHENKKQLLKISEERDAIKNRLKTETERVQFLNKERDSLNSKVLELEAKLSMSLRKPSPAVESDSSWRIEAENLISMYKQKLEEKTREVANLQTQIDNLKIETQSLTQDNSTKQFQLEMIRIELQKKETELSSKSRAEFDSLREEISHLNQENVKLREKIRELQKSETGFKLNRLKLSEYDHLSESFIPPQHLESLILKLVLSEMEIKRLQSKQAKTKDNNESMQTEPDSILNQQSVRYQRVSGTVKQRSYSTLTSQRGGSITNRDLSEVGSIDSRINLDKVRLE